MDLLHHFGLTSPPLTKEIDERDLWLPPSRSDIVTEICRTIAARESGLLVGEPGVGKTTILRATRHALAQSNVRLTYCHNATLGRRDFYRQLCVALGVSASATAAALFYAVSTRVVELGRERIHPVLILDEAHLLHQDTLDHLHILLNYEWDSKALLSIILVGLPELADRLALRHNRPLFSRLHSRIHLDVLTAEDTAAYLRRRLEQAGATAEVFASDALAMIHEAASGAMRDIDRIALLAMRTTAAQGRRIVERDAVVTVLEHDDRRR